MPSCILIQSPDNTWWLFSEVMTVPQGGNQTAQSTQCEHQQQKASRPRGGGAAKVDIHRRLHSVHYLPSTHTS